MGSIWIKSGSISRFFYRPSETTSSIYCLRPLLQGASSCNTPISLWGNPSRPDLYPCPTRWSSTYSTSWDRPCLFSAPRGEHTSPALRAIPCIPCFLQGGTWNPFIFCDMDLPFILHWCPRGSWLPSLIFLLCYVLILGGSNSILEAFFSHFPSRS